MHDQSAHDKKLDTLDRQIEALRAAIVAKEARGIAADSLKLTLREYLKAKKKMLEEELMWLAKT